MTALFLLHLPNLVEFTALIGRSPLQNTKLFKQKGASAADKRKAAGPKPAQPQPKPPQPPADERSAAERTVERAVKAVELAACEERSALLGARRAVLLEELSRIDAAFFLQRAGGCLRPASQN